MNVQNQIPRTGAEQALLALLDQRSGADDAALAGRMGELRRAARDAFAANGLPHRRVEEWKYTDLRAILRSSAPLAAPLDAAAEAEGQFRAVTFPGARRILFVNGQLSRAHSDLAGLEPGLTVVPLASALAGGQGAVEKLGTLAPQRYDGVLALNTALAEEGLVIRVEAGAQITRPLHVAHVFTLDAPAATFTRRLLDVGADARFTLVESFQGRDGVAYQVNDALELFVADGAHLDHVRIQEDSAEALHFASLMAETGHKTQFHSFALTTGALASRVSLYGRFAGTHAHVGLRGATLVKGRQHADMTLLLDHAVAHCESRELFKTVLADEARGVFQGKIVVRPDAQKTDGRMMSRALLLGETAEMDNKPELEIFADDVQCGHGATAGELDADLLFYLKARGIPAKEAEGLLIQAFVGEAIEFVEEDGLREAIIARAEAWLKARAI
ncbi:Fe-S cluster assembly protein SufD [Aquabacter cavernae]|uniref:Fe-S cluster assembly protein SufD n=1 Tax=Aquabacter cavernae TaxID=2496029 RepID=UPI000F8C4453|nr:Fe-S cluster assembly protein SufD [Aquabacter cavernae]